MIASTADVDLAVAVQRRFKEVVIEVHAERGEVAVLFVAQIGDRKPLNRIQIVDIPGRGHDVAVTLDRCARQIVTRNFGDVFAAISVFGKGDGLALQFFCARLNRKRQRCDLHTGVVVIELARDAPPLRRQQVSQCVTKRRLSRVAEVERPGRIGRNELDHDVLASVRVADAEAVGLVQHVAHHLLPRAGRQPQVDESRAGDFDRFEQRRKPVSCTHRGRRSSVATSRGFFFCAFAICSATLVAMSPCASTFGRSSVTGIPVTPSFAQALFDQSHELLFMRGKHRDAQMRRDRAKPRSLLSSAALSCNHAFVTVSPLE